MSLRETGLRKALQDAGRPNGPPPARALLGKSTLFLRQLRPADVSLVTGLLLLGVFTVFWRLDVATWHVDEVTYQAASVRNVITGDFGANREHPPLVKQVMGVTQYVLGPGLLAARLPGALLDLGTGLLVLLLGWRLGGRWVGAVAAALWWLLPQAPGVVEVRIGRYAMLESYVTFFGVLALLLAWEWGRRGRWYLAFLAGISVGLASASKFTGVMFAAGMLIAFWWAPGRRSHRVSQLLLAGFAAFLTLLTTYVATGSGWPGRLLYAVTFQLGHAQRGHAGLVAGEVSMHPPWWASFWWQQQYLGVLGMVALWGSTLLLLTAWRQRPRAVMFLLGALTVLVAVNLTSPLKLTHYHLAWSAPQALASALGLVAFWRVLSKHPDRPGLRISLQTLTVALVLVFSVLGAQTLTNVARLGPGDYQSAAMFLDERGSAESAVLVWGWPAVACKYLPADDLRGGAPPEGAIVPEPESIIIDPVVADRQRFGPTADYVEQIRSAYDEQQIDRLTVLTRRDDVPVVQHQNRTAVAAVTCIGAR